MIFRFVFTTIQTALIGWIEKKRKKFETVSGQEQRFILWDIDNYEFEYHLVQYSKDEYIKLIDDRNAELEEQLTDTQLALCDVYEMIGG